MSEENLEVVRQAVDAWNRRDVENLIALTDSNVEYVNSPTAVEPGTRRGVEEVSAVMRAQWEALTDAWWEIDRVYDHGDEVAVLGRLSRRMPDSETRLESRLLVTYTVRNGKIARTEVLGFGRDEVESALQSAGLSD
jgi:ketosteroid isomerase-like protein